MNVNISFSSSFYRHSHILEKINERLKETQLANTDIQIVSHTRPQSFRLNRPRSGISLQTGSSKPAPNAICPPSFHVFIPIYFIHEHCVSLETSVVYVGLENVKPVHHT